MNYTFEAHYISNTQNVLEIDPKRIDIARSTILSINPIQAWRENNESSREFRERNGKQRQNAMRTSTGATGPQKIMDT